LTRYRPDVVVNAVASPEAALEEIAHSPAQALIVNEPDADSPRDTDWLRRLPYGTAAITCHVSGQAQAAKAMGVSGYLMKPVQRETLLSQIALAAPEAETVLVVEDNPEAIQLLSRMLKSGARTYQVLRAMDGQRGLDLLRARRPDIMLLDLILPRMSGYDLLSAKNADPAVAQIPVIAVTAQDPIQAPLGNRPIEITKGGGLTLSDLLLTILEVGASLSPSRVRETAN
jgi:CheY-like chemotaxis protein